jgi:hypothetical protein
LTTAYFANYQQNAPENSNLTLSNYFPSPTKTAVPKHLPSSSLAFQLQNGVLWPLPYLKEHAKDHAVVKVENSPFGTRYVVEGVIQTPDGQSPLASLRLVY